MDKISFELIITNYIENKMKLALTFIVIFSFIGINFLDAQKVTFIDNLSHYIENPTLFEEGQEDGRSYFIPEKNMSLNGNWKFFWSDTPEGVPSGFFESSFNDNRWTEISVPSNWEVKGYGDKLFRNISTSFKERPPFVPKEYNPTGSYRRNFTIPSDWKGEQVFLRFEKIASASFVWVNGVRIGYNEGAQEPSEYNITKYLKPGNNTLAVCVIKYCDGYYLENQDYWRLAGIFDDVWLYAAPNVRLFDWQITTDFEESFTNATLNVNADIRKYTNDLQLPNLQMRASLYDKNNQIVSTFSSNKFSMNDSKIQVSLKTDINKPLKWASESPNLYTLYMELLDESGRIIDKSQNRIGFKKTEIRDGIFLLNGVPLKVHAQNSHMQHPEKGHVMDEQTIRKDFELLKQFNFNAVRTSHYPPVNKYLQLADEYGLFVIDEVGDEAHATEWLSDMSEYAEMYKERCKRMVLRDRNYPCILFWSAGNESGNGENIAEVINEGKKYDPTRYWMYGGNDFSHPTEDIIGPRYPTPIELEVQLGKSIGSEDRRPSFMDEYLSVAGNGGGGLDDYWNVIYSYPRIMGGAIWDYVSVGLTEKVRLLEDSSPYTTPTHLMGNAQLISQGKNKVLDLNGHDQWVEVYRQNNLEIDTDKLTLTCQIYPRKLSQSCGAYITKGSNQFGIQQKGKDSLEFYLYTNKKHIVYTSLPKNWEYNWHKVTATYNGQEMAIYIDNNKVASGNASGKIRNFPFPVNIGRNAEVHGQETDVYICDAQIDNIGIFTEVYNLGQFDKRRAALWLDFESEKDNGSFYSYGMGARTYGSIWPDRKPQPEMWQMKKSAQPFAARLIDSNNGVVEIWNRNHFLNSSVYKTTWSLEEDGTVIQHGNLDLNIDPLKKLFVKVPYSKPEIKPGKEYFITISTSLRSDEIWAKAGHEVAWEQMKLPWSKSIEQEKSKKTSPSLEETDSNVIVSGSKFCYKFDKKLGQLVSINYAGKELLRSPIVLNVWRAPLANELDAWNAETARSPNWKEGYGHSISTEMYSTGLNDLAHIPLKFETIQTENEILIYITDMNLTSSENVKKDLYIEGMQSNGIRSEYKFVINGNGEILIDHTLDPQGKMPLWFPRIGLSLGLNKSFDKVRWFGRGPQENYPDRKTGYKIGVYNSTVDNMYEPYLIPQDYGLRTDNRWVTLTDESGIGLEIKMDQLFNFNTYPFSTDNLTKAMYTYQLYKSDVNTVNLDYNTSGTGCTSRGIFPSYRVSPQKYQRVIKLRPIY